MEKNAEDSGSHHGFYSGLAGMFAFLTILCALAMIFAYCQKGCPAVLPGIPILTGLFFCMTGASLTASYWGQMGDYYYNNTSLCTRADKALVTAGFVFTIMGYVALGLGAISSCLFIFFFKAQPTHQQMPASAQELPLTAVLARAEVIPRTTTTTTTTTQQQQQQPHIVQAQVVSCSSISTDASLQGTVLGGGGGGTPSLSDKLRDLEQARVQGLLSDDEHACAKANLIRGLQYNR